MSPHNRRKDVAAKTSGLAHRDTYPRDRVCAERLKVHRSTPNRWAGGDSANPMNHDSQYMLLAERPWEYVAHMTSFAKWKTIVKLSDDELIERYWDLLEAEKHIEGADNLMSAQPGHTWLDRAQQKKRDAAIELELAAVMLEFEVRGMSEETVRGEHK